MMSEATVQEYERRAEAAEQSAVPVLLKFGRALVWVVWAIVAVNAALLTLAFFLRLFGASTDAPFTEWVYRSTERAMRPFRGIFPTQDLGDASVLDTSLLFGALFYLFVALAIDGVLRWLGHKVTQQQRRAAAARADADAAAQELARQQYVAQQTAAHDYAVAQAAAQQVIVAQQGPQPPGT